MSTCSFKGCQSPAVAKGLCATHYQQARRNPDRQLKPPRGTFAPVKLGTIRVHPDTSDALDKLAESACMTGRTAAAKVVLEQWAARFKD